MHSRKSLKQLAVIWAGDAASIAEGRSESSRHFAQGCDLIDALLEAIKERDLEIDHLHAELRREQEKSRSRVNAWQSSPAGEVRATQTSDVSQGSTENVR